MTRHTPKMGVATEHANRRRVSIRFDPFTRNALEKYAAKTSATPTAALEEILARARANDGTLRTPAAVVSSSTEEPDTPLRRALKELKRVPHLFSMNCSECQVNAPGCCGDVLRQIEELSGRLRRCLFNEDDTAEVAMQNCTAMKRVAALRVVG